MCDQQYDVSAKMRELFEIKQKDRAAAKQYYQNILYNPHRPGFDGVPFDPQLQRFSAMSSYHSENFKPKGRHFAAFVLFLAPVGLLYMRLRHVKSKQEELLRSDDYNCICLVTFYLYSFQWEKLLEVNFNDANI